MIELNALLMHSISKVYKYFMGNGIGFYPASIGVAYKELFKRDAFFCFSFYSSSNEQYYMYFNGAYNSDINRVIFTSISVVSRENLNRKIATVSLKCHIDTAQDVDYFIDLLKGMI